MRSLILAGAAALLASCASCPEDAAPAGGAPAGVALTGGEWVAESIDSAGVIDGARTTLTLSADGKLSGSGGCNRFFGSYTLDGRRLATSGVGSTKMACAPALMTQEQRFFDILSSAQSYEIRPDGALLLTTADGRSALFRKG